MATQHHIPSPMPHSFPRSCWNSDGRPKRAYRSSLAADIAAMHLEEQTGEAMRAYRCRSCSRVSESGEVWHIGHRRGEG